VTNVLYELVKSKDAALTVTRACRAVGVSRRWYPAWLHKPPDETDAELLREIQDIAAMPRYGYRRVAAELKRRKIFVNRKKVLRIMRENALLCKRKTFHPCTTDSKHGFRKYPNLIKDMTFTGLNRAWVSDITYVRLQEDFAYLASILDRYSRKCVGWALGRTLESELALRALDQALAGRKHLGFDGLIHHSDQGVQYACDAYVARLSKHGIRISMSERGNPYENAVAESFNKTIKVEEVYLSDYLDFEDALANIGPFIEEVYNKKRLHSSIGYKPPQEFEQECLKSGVA